MIDTAFFVPAASQENQEEIYAQLAQWCGRAVPQLGSRVYSITYVHDGEEWTATVGETLSGNKLITSKGTQIIRKLPIADPALVLAIFADAPFMVVTNHRLGGINIGSKWENPFMAGRPRSITYFVQT